MGRKLPGQFLQGSGDFKKIARSGVPLKIQSRTSVSEKGSEFGVQLTLAIATLLSSLGVSIANTALPSIAAAFGASFSSVRWVIVSYLLAITVTVVSAGRLGDIFGRRRIFLSGIVLYAAASFLCGLAPSLDILVSARAAQGIGGAIAIALSQALVTESVPKAKMGRTMGLLGTMSAVGTALGPSLSGFLIAGAGWRAVFLILVPIALLVLALALRFVPTHESQAGASLREFDLLGAVLLGITLALYSFSMSAAEGGFGRRNILLLLCAISFGIFFTQNEKRKIFPLVRIDIVRNIALTASLAMNAIVSTVMMSTLVVGPFYLSHGLGFGDAQVGLMMSVGPGFSILSGIPAGRIVDYLGTRKVVLIGLGTMALGAACLALLPPILGASGYFVSVALLSPGYQLFLAANSTAVMADVVPEQRGVISGVLSLSRNLGLITGASAMGAIFSAASGIKKDSLMNAVAATDGLRATFLVATFLVLLALGAAIAVKKA